MEKASEWLSSFSSIDQNQVNALKNHEVHERKKTEIISITGGKGGVGKTSVALKLSKTLAASGKKVLLIDCDTNLSNTALKLGLPIDNTFYSLVSAERNFIECLYKEDNFHLLAACNGSIDLFDSKFRLEDIIIDILNSHASDYDYVFLDCPAGLSRDSLTLNAYSDKRVFIVTPDKSSVTDSYSLIKVLNKKFGVNENHILINKVTQKGQFEKIVKTLSETVENFLGCRTKVLGGIRYIDVGRGSFDQALLESGKNDLQKSFDKVINRLAEELVGNEESSSSMRKREQEVH